MGYYLRFFATGEPAPTLEGLEELLGSVDPAYALTERGADAATLTYGGEILGLVELESPPEPEELEELLESVGEEGRPKKNRAEVKRVLSQAHRAVVIQVLTGERGWDATWERLFPVWEWLLTQHAGLAQADGEGYYNAEKQVLRVG